MKKKMMIHGVTVLLGIHLVVGTALFLRAQPDEPDSIYQNIAIFTRALEAVHKQYVDGEDLSYRELIHRALRGMLNTLDPHTEFMVPEKYDNLKEDTEGTFGGIGVVVQATEKGLLVISPIDGTPGAQAGLMSGELIVAIDGTSTPGMKIQDAVKILRGKPGTDVQLEIFNTEKDQKRTVAITRAIVKVNSVTDIHGKQEYPLTENGFGYVRLSKFGEKTDEELGVALKVLETEGMKGLVMDLRDNPGGLLDVAVEICDRFLPENELIVTTEGRDGKVLSVFKARTREQFPGLPIVILVNNASASASEIVSGCLQDLKRAIILGEQTFGKGSVQSIIPLPDESAIRLTTAKYYTPSHKVIHEKGIKPDIEVPMTLEQRELLARKRNFPEAGNYPAEELKKIKEASDPQLDRALDLLHGVSRYEAMMSSPRGTGSLASTVQP